jgi:hypothetical protein
MRQLMHRQHSLTTKTGRPRRLTVVLAGLSLAAGLTASLAPVEQAAAVTRTDAGRASTHTRQHSSSRPVAGQRSSGQRSSGPQLPEARLADGSAAVVARLRAELAALPPGARLAGPPTARSGLRPAGLPAEGRITGLLRGMTGAPFGGACITATGRAGSTTVRSLPDGRYLIADLRPGPYRLRVDECPASSLVGTQAGADEASAGQHRAGQHRAGLDWAGASLSYVWPGLPAIVTVLASEVRTLPPVTVWPTDLSVLAGGGAPVQPASSGSRTGSISGQVTGAGQPRRGICAIALPDTFSNRHGPLPRAATARDGSYRIAGLRPGRYLVLFRTGLRSCPSDANWLPQWYPYVNSPFATAKAVGVRVRPGRDTGDIDGRLKLGAEITGITATRSGRPVRGICVSLYTPYTIWGSYIVGSAATSGNTGHYALRGLFPGKYQVQFTIGCGTAGNYAQQWWRDRTAPGHASLIKVKSRQIVAGIDARLVPGGAVAGTVRAKTAAEKPLPRVCVYVTDYAGDYANVVTAKNGTYEAEGLNTGKYQVSFDPTCEGFVSANYLPAQRTVAITAGHTRSSFNAFLAPAAGLSGVVRNQAGKPVGSVCVNVDDKNNDYAFTNANGTYSISGIVPGKYQLYFEADCQSSGSLADQWYDDQPDGDSADWLTFTAGKTDRNVDVTLHPGGTLAGQLVTPNGQPVKGTCVGLAAPDNVLDWGSFNGTASSHDGHYVISDLTPGEYQVTFECQAGRYASQWFNAQPDSTTAEYLAINPGVTTTLNQKVSLAGRVTGTVTNPAGHPIGGICVFLANAKNGELIEPISGGAETARGRYTVAELTPAVIWCSSLTATAVSTAGSGTGGRTASPSPPR